MTPGRALIAALADAHMTGHSSVASDLDKILLPGRPVQKIWIPGHGGRTGWVGDIMANPLR